MDNLDNVMDKHIFLSNYLKELGWEDSSFDNNYIFYKNFNGVDKQILFTKNNTLDTYNKDIANAINQISLLEKKTLETIYNEMVLAHGGIATRIIDSPINFIISTELDTIIPNFLKNKNVKLIAVPQIDEKNVNNIYINYSICNKQNLNAITIPMSLRYVPRMYLKLGDKIVERAKCDINILKKWFYKYISDGAENTNE